MRCIILDLETTGLNPDKGDTIIDVAAIRVGPDGIEDRFQSLVHPGTGELSPFIEAMTGISSAMLAEAPAWSTLADQVRAFVGDDLPVVGHNISFDANFLKLFGVDIAPTRLVDTCDFASIYFPHASSHSLEVLSSYLHLEHLEKHRAMGDVLATYELLRCLLRERNMASGQLLEAANTLAQKAPAWPGLQFFSLEAPLMDAQEAAVTKLDTADLISYEGQGRSRFILQPSVLRTLQWSAAQSPDAIVLVSPSEAETVRDMVYEYDLGCFLDNAEQFVDPKLAVQLIERDHWSDNEALFGFRLLAHGALHGFTHQAALGLSHKEKQLLGAFAASPDDAQAIIAQAANKRLFVTYHAWHQYKDFLPQDRLWIIPDAMRLELHLFQTAKSYMSMDSLVSRLKNLTARTEALGLKVGDLQDSLEYVARYAFQGLVKLLRHDQRELAFDGVPDLLSQFHQTWEKGMQKWQEVLQTSDESSAVEKQRQHLSDTVRKFLEGMNDTAKLSMVCRLPQGVMLQQELKSLESARVWFNAIPTCHTLQGYVDDRFALFIDPEQTQIIDAAPMDRLTFQHGVSSRLAESMSVVEQVQMLEEVHHVAFCTGGGTTLDKIFEQLYHDLHGKTWTVLSSGKTGGRGKVRYGFTHQDPSLLVATAQDAKGLGVPADAVVLSSLPFAAVMGPYWQSQYGDNSFGTLTLPLLTQQIVDLTWAAAQPQTSLYITDTRLFEKQYGQEIIQVLSRFMAVR